MITLSTPMQNVMLCVLVLLVVLIVFSLIYAIFSHRFTDKIVAANMIGSLTMNIVVILAFYLGQSYILDVGIVIATLSFLSVIVLCRVVTDHIFGQMRHMNEKANGNKLSKASMATAGTEQHRVNRDKVTFSVSSIVEPVVDVPHVTATNAAPTAEKEG